MAHNNNDDDDIFMVLETWRSLFWCDAAAKSLALTMSLSLETRFKKKQIQGNDAFLTDLLTLYTFYGLEIFGLHTWLIGSLDHFVARQDTWITLTTHYP